MRPLLLLREAEAVEGDDMAVGAEAVEARETPPRIASRVSAAARRDERCDPARETRAEGASGRCSLGASPPSESVRNGAATAEADEADSERAPARRRSALVGRVDDGRDDDDARGRARDAAATEEAEAVEGLAERGTGGANGSMIMGPEVRAWGGG